MVRRTMKGEKWLKVLSHCLPAYVLCNAIF